MNLDDLETLQTTAIHSIYSSAEKLHSLITKEEILEEYKIFCQENDNCKPLRQIAFEWWTKGYFSEITESDSESAKQVRQQLRLIENSLIEKGIKDLEEINAIPLHERYKIFDILPGWIGSIVQKTFRLEGLGPLSIEEVVRRKNTAAKINYVFYEGSEYSDLLLELMRQGYSKKETIKILSEKLDGRITDDRVVYFVWQTYTQIEGKMGPKWEALRTDIDNWFEAHPEFSAIDKFPSEEINNLAIKHNFSRETIGYFTHRIREDRELWISMEERTRRTDDFTLDFLLAIQNFNKFDVKGDVLWEEFIETIEFKTLAQNYPHISLSRQNLPKIYYKARLRTGDHTPDPDKFVAKPFVVQELNSILNSGSKKVSEKELHNIAQKHSLSFNTVQSLYLEVRESRGIARTMEQRSKDAIERQNSLYLLAQNFKDAQGNINWKNFLESNEYKVFNKKIGAEMTRKALTNDYMRAKKRLEEGEQ